MIRTLKTKSDWLSVSTDIKIDELRNYLNTLRKQLESMTDEYKSKIDAEARKIKDEEDRQEFYEWSGDEYWNYKETFPRILLNSFHVTAYTLLESQIYSIATKIGKKQKQLFDVSELRGNDYLQSAYYYINRLTGIKCNQYDSWNAITEGRRLRNIIVHSNGEVMDDKDVSIAKKYDVLSNERITISGRPIYEISINYEYSKVFIGTIWSFFSELYKETNAGDFL